VSNLVVCTFPRRNSSIGGSIGFGALILLAVFVVFYVVWRSDPTKVHAEDPFKTIKTWSPEDRTPANFVSCEATEGGIFVVEAYQLCLLDFVSDV
jgi:hypothetical protein